jgi:hypothetical protein
VGLGSEGQGKSIGRTPRVRARQARGLVRFVEVNIGKGSLREPQMPDRGTSSPPPPAPTTKKLHLSFPGSLSDWTVQVPLFLLEVSLVLQRLRNTHPSLHGFGLHGQPSPYVYVLGAAGPPPIHFLSPGCLGSGPGRAAAKAPRKGSWTPLGAAPELRVSRSMPPAY